MEKKTLSKMFFSFTASVLFLFAGMEVDEATAAEPEQSGLTRDAEYVKAHCGVGNYLFRNLTACPRTEYSEAVMPEELVNESRSSFIRDPERYPYFRETIDEQLAFYFDTNRSDITNDHQIDLSETVAYLRDHPNAKVEISGFADGTGDLSKNERLANKRALALQNYLITRGVSPNQLMISTPDTAVSTAKNNEEDRRVEMTVRTVLAE